MTTGTAGKQELLVHTLICICWGPPYTWCCDKHRHHILCPRWVGKYCSVCPCSARGGSDGESEVEGGGPSR